MKIGTEEIETGIDIGIVVKGIDIEVGMIIRIVIQVFVSLDFICVIMIMKLDKIIDFSILPLLFTMYLSRVL